MLNVCEISLAIFLFGLVEWRSECILLRPSDSQAGTLTPHLVWGAFSVQGARHSRRLDCLSVCRLRVGCLPLGFFPLQGLHSPRFVQLSTRIETAILPSFLLLFPAGRRTRNVGRRDPRVVLRVNALQILSSSLLRMAAVLFLRKTRSKRTSAAANASRKSLLRWS